MHVSHVRQTTDYLKYGIHNFKFPCRISAEHKIVRKFGVIRVPVKYIFSGTHYTLPEIRYYYLLLKDTNDWRAED